MSQLELFRDAPVYYHEALAHLSRLDPGACRLALERHRRSFPRGPDPAPIQEAVDWLETLTPEEPRAGEALLSACRALREGRAPGFARLGSGTGAAAARALARRGLAASSRAGIGPGDPLAQGLPWGVLSVFAGDPAAARRALSPWVEGAGSSPLGWLALGDSLWFLGRQREARGAYREACGLDPGCPDEWKVADPELEGVRRQAQEDPVFAGDWWAVGACLGGGFPPFGRWDTRRLAPRWERFETVESEAAPGPVAFFLALGLSEQGPALGMERLARVRSTLRRLHPEAYELHMEGLAG